MKYFLIPIGRINSGGVKVGEKIQAVDPSGKVAEVNKVFKILRRYGMSQVKFSIKIMRNPRLKWQKLWLETSSVLLALLMLQ
jgi:hypothetical protein